jgi:hypothetical protein
MRFAIALTLTSSLALSSAAASSAATIGGSLIRYQTSLQSSSNSFSTKETGTLRIVTTRPGAITLTIQPDGGKPPETTALIVGAQGSFALDPTVKAPGSQTVINRAIQFMTEITAANYVGTGATSSQGATFTIPPVTIIPAGSGTAVQTQITLTRVGFLFTGSAQRDTTTVLPAAGTSSVRDTISLVVGVSTDNNQLGAIEGMQTDRATFSGKPATTITTTLRWAFSAAN